MFICVRPYTGIRDDEELVLDTESMELKYIALQDIPDFFYGKRVNAGNYLISAENLCTYGQYSNVICIGNGIKSKERSILLDRVIHVIGRGSDYMMHCNDVSFETKERIDKIFILYAFRYHSDYVIRTILTAGANNSEMWSFLVTKDRKCKAYWNKDFSVSYNKAFGLQIDMVMDY